MPIASRRAPLATARPRAADNEAPEATGAIPEILDVISVSPGPDGPFGHDLR
jgi:hypothetical protein